VYQHLCYNQAFCRLEQTISSVEIFWKEKLYRIYFPQPHLIDLALEDATKYNMLAELDLSTPEDRAKGIMDNCELLIHEMQHFEHLHAYNVGGIRCVCL
jgi:hypothetical protein